MVAKKFLFGGQGSDLHDHQATGVYRYLSLPDFPEGQPIRTTKRADVIAWLNRMGAGYAAPEEEARTGSRLQGRGWGAGAGTGDGVSVGVGVGAGLWPGKGRGGGGGSGRIGVGGRGQRQGWLGSRGGGWDRGKAVGLGSSTRVWSRHLLTQK